MERRAKIVATIGPSSSDEETLLRIFEAGVDVVRLNQSHGTRQGHRELLRRVRSVSERNGFHVAIVVDLMGPRFRLGTVPDGVILERDAEVTLGDEEGVDLPIDNPSVMDHLEPGERFLVDNGLIELSVLEKSGRTATARVIAGGPVSTRKGINLPDSRIPFEVSEKDRDDIRMAVEEGADYLAASYVGRAEDVEEIRAASREAGTAIPIIAKLERMQAITNLDDIVACSEAVMVARGDLGVEIPHDEVPVVQKRIIDAGWRLGKPVVVATQMLESMMEYPRPTRAESSDVANAVIDGADAMMLSGETAAGRYPVESVDTMCKIIRRTEEYQWQKSLEAHREGFESLQMGPYDLEPPQRPDTELIPETVSASSVLAAKQTDARCIVALSQGGFTARMLACRRPSTPVIAFTQQIGTARRLQLVWGTRSLLMRGEPRHHDEVVGLVDRYLLEAGLAKAGDCIIILMGDPLHAKPPTNLMRIHRVRSI